MISSNSNESISNWHSGLVLIAKNTYVWLGQLSKKYGRQIETLDQIPQDELLWLRSMGISGLWLIGVWKRSPASARIKSLYGRHHLTASAYSILEYIISDELGGEPALEELKSRAWQAGIQLACDMVPNHTGIDANWVTNHPDWYIFTHKKPVNSWEYNSPDLSRDPRAEIRIEDGYYNQVEAAETFRMHFKDSGEPLFIYHGNDGTSMPWNDTAQLNYLNVQVRETVKDIIVRVARQFKIIRLDAAMTLIRKHYKRLWFPDVGAKKHVPTRERFTMSQEEFDQFMPNEFWQEVMDELHKKAPGTLILAEAFWLMEKYFIKELGVHRVYNSAFMNQLQDENNKELFNYFREIMQSDQKLMERFINYLTTPDEDTAAVKFGKSSKYFGACGLMACLPGLPLFGHGQIEGLEEKFGMDFKVSLLGEIQDENFIKQHTHLIAPLLNKRKIFCNSDNLKLYGFQSENNRQDFNIFAFSNQVDETRYLFLFNNQDKSVEGWITEVMSGKMNLKERFSHDQLNVDSLKIGSAIDTVYFYDERTGRDFVLKQDQMKKGIPIRLGPYEFACFQVFLNAEDMSNVVQISPE